MIRPEPVDNVEEAIMAEPGIRVTWLGHATLVLEAGGVRILTDPLLRPGNGILRRRGPAPRRDQWEGAAVTLMSHLHHDHAELASLRLLGDTPVLTGTANAAFLRRRGVDGVGLADEWYDVPGTGVRIRLVRAVHHSRPMPHRPNDAHGHLIRFPGATVWVAGDTSLYDEMDRLPEIAGAPIDLAVVPVGGWGARLSPGHLDPRTAARACELAGAKVAMPYHWGSLYVPGTSTIPAGWMDRPGAEFPEAIARGAPGCEPLVLRPGEAASL